MNAINIDFAQFVQIQHSQPVTTSEFIAQAFNKRHADVLRKIDEITMQVPDFFGKRNFALVEKGRENNLGFKVIDKAYELTKDGFMLLVMGFTGKDAMAIKIAYIEAFNQMADRLKQIESSNKVQICQYLNDWEQEQIRVAVKNRSMKTGETTQAIYVKLHLFMRVARYEQISQADFQTALNYLASIQNAPEIIKPQHQLRNIEPLLSHALMCAEFIYWHDSAIRKLNKRLAFNIYDHAKDAICCIRSTADELGKSLPSHQFFEKFPWDGDYFERIEYRKQHLA